MVSRLAASPAVIAHVGVQIAVALSSPPPPNLLTPNLPLSTDADVAKNLQLVG